MTTSMDVDEPEYPWLDTVEGEIAFFRALTRARPVGIHKHFHVLTMRNAILRDTGKLVEVDDLWKKLRTCYDLDNLENIVSEPPVSSPCRVRSLFLPIPRVHGRSGTNLLPYCVTPSAHWISLYCVHDV